MLGLHAAGSLAESHSERDAVAEKKELSVTNLNMSEIDASIPNDMVPAFAQHSKFDMSTDSIAIHEYDMSSKYVQFDDNIAVHEFDMAPNNF